MHSPPWHFKSGQHQLRAAPSRVEAGVDQATWLWQFEQDRHVFRGALLGGQV